MIPVLHSAISSTNSPQPKELITTTTIRKESFADSVDWISTAVARLLSLILS